MGTKIRLSLSPLAEFSRKPCLNLRSILIQRTPEALHIHAMYRCTSIDVYIYIYRHGSSIKHAVHPEDCRQLHLKETGEKEFRLAGV